MADDDTIPELLPPGGPNLAVDQDLEDILGGVPEEDDEEILPLGRGWAFDFQKGEFVMHGTSPARVSGLDQLRVWIEKTVRTRRLAHPIYSEEHGIEHEDLIGKPFDSIDAGTYGNAITEALLPHDRIAEVRDFVFTFDPEDPDDPDALLIGFSVVTDAGDVVPVADIPTGGF